MKDFLPYNSSFISLRLFLFLSVIAGIGCNPSRKMMKEATLLENGGLHSEALSRYDEIYSGYTTAEALVGMKRVAQHMYNSKMNKAQLLCMSEHYDEALTAYDDVISFRDSYSKLELGGGKSPEAARAECKSSYINMLYNTADNYMKQEDYENAHIYIRKIFSLDRNNRKAEYLDALCEILPNYKAGLIAAEKGLWRDAFVYFNEVCRVDAGFSDALKQREEARKNGSFSIVYKITDNRFVDNRNEESLAAVIKGRLLNADNPFIELLEREDIDVIIREQQETMSPEYEGQTGPEAGKLKRAKFLLSGELLSLEYDENPEVRSKCDCGKVFRIYSDKVNCYQLTSSASLNATFKYKLLDAETGKLYKSDVITFADNDTGNDYHYEIQQKISLTSPTGFRDHDVNLSGAITPPADPLLSEQEMLNRMNEFFALKVGKAIDDFRP